MKRSPLILKTIQHNTQLTTTCILHYYMNTIHWDKPTNTNTIKWVLLAGTKFGEYPKFCFLVVLILASFRYLKLDTSRKMEIWVDLIWRIFYFCQFAKINPLPKSIPCQNVPLYGILKDNYNLLKFVRCG